MNNNEIENRENKAHASLNYYLAGLQEARDQGNTESALYFIQQIAKLSADRAASNQILLVVMAVLIIVNFITTATNTYFLLIK